MRADIIRQLGSPQGPLGDLETQAARGILLFYKTAGDVGVANSLLARRPKDHADLTARPMMQMLC